MKFQSARELVDVAHWGFDDQFSPYPEGSRDKSAVVCPDPAPFQFLIPGQRYLFKQSNKNYPSQFWAEIIAYKVGCSMGVPVPPAFAAFHSVDNNRPATLIEWFYDWNSDAVRYVSGGNYMTRLIPSYDTRRGSQHNVDTIIKLAKVFEKAGLMSGATEHWGRVFMFDALIGNTDRHQDNWGLLWTGRKNESRRTKFSPAFDNGTSLGHEIIEKNLRNFRDANKLKRYISRGCHHPLWSLKDSARMQHADLARRFYDQFPEAREAMLECLGFDLNALDDQIREACSFECAAPFSAERCEFVLSLLRARYKNLEKALG